MSSYKLISSQKEFFAHKAPSKYYLDRDELIKNPRNYKFNLKENGFVVIQNVFKKDYIDQIKDAYFNLFKGNFIRKEKNWIQISNPEIPHGCGDHPAKIFVKSKLFLEFINNDILKEISKVLLSSKESVLTKRAIIRSFSKISNSTTAAHRDREYYKSNDNSKVVTVWIPLGNADINHGQLIYLENSHKAFFKDRSELKGKQRIISYDLGDLANKTSKNWLIPKVNKGDVIFHCLNIVHASFESNSNEPRLSCDLRFGTDLKYLDQRWNNYWYGDDGL